MAHPSNLYNVTPHPIVIYDSKHQSVLVEIRSHGTLRLKTSPQVNRESIPLGESGASIPVLSGQVFIGIEELGTGWELWNAHEFGSFVVSLPMAQWLTTTGTGRVLIGMRRILCPATGPSHSVRDGSGQLKGCTALEVHT